MCRRSGDKRNFLRSRSGIENVVVRVWAGWVFHRLFCIDISRQACLRRWIVSFFYMRIAKRKDYEGYEPQWKRTCVVEPNSGWWWQHTFFQDQFFDWY